ncbi:MAG: LamG-like jellyroll fold domain-containing protein [Planctomycetota bacterium]
MSAQQSNHELDLLIDAHLDQSIDDESSRRLLQFLQEDPDASAKLIERSRLSYQLIQVLKNEQSRDAIDPLDFEDLQSIEPESVELRRVELEQKVVKRSQPKAQELPTRESSQGASFGIAGLSIHVGRGSDGGVSLGRLLAYAAVLAFVAGVIWALMTPTNQVQAPESVESQDTSPPSNTERVLAARLIGTVDPIWDGPAPSDVAVFEGEQVFRLLSGYAELAFERGARVIIEGPCDFEVLDENSMRVQRGRLVANVPTQAQLFTVKTPSAEVIDFGTEFFVDVLTDGDTEVAVLDGLVELHESAKDSSQVTHQIALAAGQMSRVDSELGLDSNIKSFELDSKRIYVRQLEDAKSVDVAYARLVQALKPVAYWPMMGDNPLVGESFDSDGYTLTAVGEAELQRAAGPKAFADSQAVQIDGGQTFYIASPFDSKLWTEGEYSFSIWIRLDERASQNIISFVPSLQQRGNHFSNQIRINASGKLEHYTFCPTNINPELDKYAVVRAESSRPIDTEKWVHLAVTYGDRRSRLFLDGKLVAQERARHKFEIGYPTLLVGGATGYSRDDKAGDFKGAACQFVIFNRALTLKEVKALSRPSDLTEH